MSGILRMSRMFFEEIRLITPSYAGMTYKRLEEGFLHWPCPTEEHPGTPVLHTERFASRRQSVIRSLRLGAAARVARRRVSLYRNDRQKPLPLSLWHNDKTKRPRQIYKRTLHRDKSKRRGRDKCGRRRYDNRDVAQGKRDGQTKVTDAVREKMVFLPFHFSGLRLTF